MTTTTRVAATGKPSTPPPAPSRRRGRRVGSHGWLPYGLVAPLTVFIVALALYPTVLTLVGAFEHNDAISPPTRFDGLANFRSIFNDPVMLRSFENTGLYVVFGVLLSVGIGTAFAVLLQRGFRGRGAILAIMVLPWALPPVVEGVIWSWIYDPTFGVLNSALHSLGAIGHYQLWIGTNAIESIFFISVVQVWQITPLAALLVLASLQSIPPDLYEAASVDGATRWQVLRRVTLPLVRPGLAIATVEGLVMSINIFDQVYVLNSGATTAASIMLQTYDVTFNNLNFGQGYALSLLATVSTVVLSLLAVRLIYRKVEL